MEIKVVDIQQYFEYVNKEIDQNNYIPVKGTIYLEVLNQFHKILKPKTYLEIGINYGDSLRLANCKAIGVDPEPKMKDNGEYLIYAKTSDSFFVEEAKNLFQIDKIDLGFIDGMHLFEFALRDFINTEKYAHKNSYILIHDILPRYFSEASRGMVTQAWTGDVWRCIMALKKYRPDLNITILDSSPTGLAVITNLNPNSYTLINNYDQIVKEVSEMNTLSFLQARDLIMQTFSSELYLREFLTLMR
jgi:hypothetical protein